MRPRRSVLYMPGSNARALEKAKTLAADALILDLEDAVAPDAKEIARKQVCEAVKAGGFGPREVSIRVNGFTTPYGAGTFRPRSKRRRTRSFCRKSRHRLTWSMPASKLPPGARSRYGR